jgi:hypothetical protein
MVFPLSTLPKMFTSFLYLKALKNSVRVFPVNVADLAPFVEPVIKRQLPALRSQLI